MQAWRNFGGDVREVTVDVGLDGNPILPPDTTVNPKPVALTGHYVTVVNNDWVQIESPVAVITLDSLKSQKLATLSTYRVWYLAQPVTANGFSFDADDAARNSLAQALVMYSNLAYLPPGWVTHDNKLFPIKTVDDLKGIVVAVSTAYTTKFFECNAIRQSIYDATDATALAAIVVPNTSTLGLV